jgi:VWFA-related protein
VKRACVLLAALAVPHAGRAQDAQDVVPQGQFRERVVVERVLLDLRIVDSHGEPIAGLGPGDVRVSVDGTPATVDSLRWISGTTPYSEGLAPAQAAANGVAAAAAGRLIVFFFQKDLMASRSLGLLRMKREAARLLASLESEDRVAVASFDTHLRLWTDFTTDRARLRHIVERSILFDEESRRLPATGTPSLVASYDAEAARDAASPEQALMVLARALSPVPGTKSLAFFGFGLGHSSGGLLSMATEYEAARQALREARTVVFCLDITDADAHSLEAGLQQLADDTGGFYAKTRDFPNLAMNRLERALEGYYSLAFMKPPLPRGRHSVTIDVPGQKASVLMSASYVD